MSHEFGFPGLQGVEPKKHRAALGAAALVFALFLTSGIYLLMVPWVGRSALFSDCAATMRGMLVCYASLHPEVPFALLGVGAAGLVLVVWRLRR